MPGKRIGIIGLDGVPALDIVGPVETFAGALQEDGSECSYYEVALLGLTRQSIGLYTLPSFSTTSTRATPMASAKCSSPSPPLRTCRQGLSPF